MKILIILYSTVFTRRGGAEVQADFIRAACVEAGHEVHFIFDSNDPFEDQGDGTHYHRLPNHGRLKAWRNALAVGKLIEEIQPDIIYQRVRFSYTGISAYYARKHDIAFVHGISSDIACRKNTVKLNHKVFSEAITEYLGRYGIKRADLLITQTSEQAADLAANFGLDSITIPNGHPLPETQPTTKSGNKIAWIASVKPWKQPELFVELARRLSDTNIQFYMAGKAAGAAYHEAFLQTVESTPNLQYLGELSLAEVNDLLSESTLFINTSQPREGFPNTFIQAWLRGTPVISLHSDPGNAIRDNNLGSVSGSLDQMEKDIRLLLDNQTQLQQAGARARQFAEENYDIQVTAGKHLQLFESIVAGKKR